MRNTQSTTFSMRVTVAERELIHAAAKAMGWPARDCLLTAPLAMGAAGLAGRWSTDGLPLPPAVRRLVDAHAAVVAERAAVPNAAAEEIVASVTADVAAEAKRNPGTAAN